MNPFCGKCGKAPSHTVEEVLGLAPIRLTHSGDLLYIGPIELDGPSQSPLMAGKDEMLFHCADCGENWYARFSGESRELKNP